MMKIVFMGSGEFACPVASALLDHRAGELVAVVTQPDRPKGRNRQMAACPVKEVATARGARVLTPEKIADAVAELQALQPDLIVVADYGQYIPQTVLAIPPKKAINVHPSLLPKYRGAAPIQWALVNGDAMTGVTVQYVARKMDSGDIVLQQEFEIGPDETAAALEARLSKAGAELAMRAIELIGSGHVHAVPQDEAKATYARKLLKEDGRIRWKQSAVALFNHLRAFDPWPGSYCVAPGGTQQLKVLAARVRDGSGMPGAVMGLPAEGPLVAAGEGVLQLLKVQPEGKKPMAAADWARGHRVNVDDFFS